MQFAMNARLRQKDWHERPRQEPAEFQNHHEVEQAVLSRKRALQTASLSRKRRRGNKQIVIWSQVPAGELFQKHLNHNETRNGNGLISVGAFGPATLNCAASGLVADRRVHRRRRRGPRRHDAAIRLGAYKNILIRPFAALIFIVAGYIFYRNWKSTRAGCPSHRTWSVGVAIRRATLRGLGAHRGSLTLGPDAARQSCVRGGLEPGPLREVRGSSKMESS